MADDVILGVHSNVRKGEIDPETGQAYGFDTGLAWISVTRDGKTNHHGLWPDGHPRVEDNGSGSDIRFAQADGYGLKESAVDARAAANTQVHESEAALVMADARTAPQPIAESRAAPQIDAPTTQLG